jgi:SAM-dependent methyltransferase
MAAIGQAQAAADLTRYLIESSRLRPGSRVVIVGAGTGQVLEFQDAGLLRPYRLTFTDLNPRFLDVLRARLIRHHLTATVLVDDFESTKLDEKPDLLLGCLLLEQIDWRRGAKAIAALRPMTCGLIIQQNPRGLSTALTPGRPVPSSVRQAMTVAHPNLIPRTKLVEVMRGQGYPCCDSSARDVADDKKLVGLLFIADRDRRIDRSRAAHPGLRGAS